MGLMTVIHEASGVALHVQASPVVTVAVIAGEVMHGLNSTGPTEYWHAPASPACVTVNV